MIRKYNKNDIDRINELLGNFNINYDNLNKEFLNILVYEIDKIEAILVYDLLYDRIEIEYIIVDFNKRRKGIASKLIEQLDEFDVNNITLEVRESNISAINFYEKNGYKKIAIRKNYYKEENGILMMKKLGE